MNKGLGTQSPNHLPARRACAKDIGAAFQNRSDLRPTICSALQRLCLQNRSALQAGGAGDSLGPSQPVGLVTGGPGAAEDDDEGSDDGAVGGAADVPVEYTAEVAVKCGPSFTSYYSTSVGQPTHVVSVNEGC